MTPCAPLFLALPFLSGAAAADTIRLVDGKAIENVQVVSDGLKEVAYKEGRSDRTVPSDTVLAIEYDKRPPQLGEVEGLLLQDDAEGAIDLLDAFIQSATDKPNLVKDFKWAPAHAAWRAVEVRLGAADVEGAKGAAARVIQSYPESRFVPMAYLAKASCELDLGQADQAQKTLGDLSGLVSAQSLGKGLELEVRLVQIQADPKTRPAAKRSEYERVLGEAGAFPLVKATAQVRIGESYLAEAAASPAGAKDLRAKARAAFEAVLASESAGRAALAAAHAGRGESLFLLGADVDDKALLEEAVLSFLRVATLYRDQGRVVAKSLFYAMRCFDLLPDPRRKAEMKRELGALFPSTTWAAEAKKY